MDSVGASGLCWEWEEFIEEANQFHWRLLACGLGAASGPHNNCWKDRVSPSDQCNALGCVITFDTVAKVDCWGVE
jgi:hypothetical protein